jgi:hypothetical protein
MALILDAPRLLPLVKRRFFPDTKLPARCWSVRLLEPLVLSLVEVQREAHRNIGAVRVGTLTGTFQLGEESLTSGIGALPASAPVS